MEVLPEFVVAHVRDHLETDEDGVSDDLVRS